MSDRPTPAELPLVCVLGSVGVRGSVGDRGRTSAATQGVGGPKPQAVLTRLALDAPSVVSVDRLIDTVWGPNPPAKPEVTLRTYISHLRRALEPAAVHLGVAPTELLVTRSPGYCLELPLTAIDVHRFRLLATEVVTTPPASSDRALVERHLERCRAALALWPSGRLGDGPLGDLLAESTALIDQRAAVAEQALRTQLVLGRPAEAVSGLQTLVADAPLREEPRRLLILALYRTGRAAEAVRAHEQARKDLAEDLGLELSPSLQDLDRRILAHDPGLLVDDPAPLPTASPAQSLPTGQSLPPTPSPAADPTPLAGRGPVVGRDAELAVGHQRIDRVLRGGGALVVLTGEPGIGKTTLATAFAERAATGARVAWGRCHDGGESTTLWPWARLLRELLDGIDGAALIDVVGTHGPEIAGVVPDLGRRLDTEPAVARDDRSLGDAIASVLRRLAARRPVVIVLEDLHWADRASVELLATIAPTLLDGAVGIVATWRSTEAVDETVRARLHEIGRLAAEARFDLPGLDHDALVRLIADQGLAALSADDVEQLLGRTAGNPLFVRELLRRPNDRSTATVREAIDRRLDVVGEEVVDLLTTAALSRRPLTATVLADALDLRAEAVEDRIERAVIAGLLERVTVLGAMAEEERIAFTHALIAERLAERLPASRRGSRHAALARALESAGAPAESLAFHYTRGVSAGTTVDAAAWSWRAARAAMALHDHTTAERLLDQAAELLGSETATDQNDQTDQTEQATGLRIDVLLDLAQVAKFHARYLDAHTLSSSAFRLAVAADDVDRMCVAALVFAGQVRAETNRYGTQWLGYWNPAGPSVAMLEACLARLAEGDPRHPSIQIALAAQLFGDQADPERGRQLSLDALAAARSMGDDVLLTEGLFTFHTALQRVLGDDERRSILDELDTAATRAGLVERRLDACRARYLAALGATDRRAADRQIARAGQLASTSDDYLMRVQHRTMEISDLLLRGDLATASTLLGASFQEFESIGFTSLEVFGIQFAAAQQELGQLDTVITLLEQRTEGYPGPAYGLPLASVLVDAGRFDEAAAMFSSFDPAEVLSGGEGVLQFSSLAFAADVAVAVGTDEEVAQLFDALRPARHRMVAMFDGLVVRGLGSLHLGRLAARLGRTDDAAALLAEARSGHRALGAGPFELRTLLALAALEGPASFAHSQAEELGEQLGMGWLVESRRRLADHRR